jgi:hypothetical protein
MGQDLIIIYCVWLWGTDLRVLSYSMNKTLLITFKLLKKADENAYWLKEKRCTLD